MVWQEKVAQIVMLTNLVEETQVNASKLFVENCFFQYFKQFSLQYLETNCINLSYLKKNVKYALCF